VVRLRPLFARTSIFGATRKIKFSGDMVRVTRLKKRRVSSVSWLNCNLLCSSTSFIVPLETFKGSSTLLLSLCLIGYTLCRSFSLLFSFCVLQRILSGVVIHNVYSICWFHVMPRASCTKPAKSMLCGSCCQFLRHSDPQSAGRYCASVDQNNGGCHHSTCSVEVDKLWIHTSFTGCALCCR